MPARVTGFPFSWTSAPMYDGSTLLFVAKAVAEGSPVGLLLAAWVYVVYALARAAEEYVGCVVLRVGWTCLASRAGRVVAVCVWGGGRRRGAGHPRWCRSYCSRIAGTVRAAYRCGGFVHVANVSALVCLDCRCCGGRALNVWWMPLRLTCRVFALLWVPFSTAAAPSRPIFTRGQKPRPRRAPHPSRSVSRARLYPLACPWASVKAYCEQQVVIQSLLEPVESVSTKACVPTPRFRHLLSAVTPHVAPSLLAGALALFSWFRVSTLL